MSGNEYEIALLGEAGTFAGANALGIKVFNLDRKKDTSEQLEDLILSNKYAIIYISSLVATEASSILDLYSDDFIPAIITLPSSEVKYDNLASLRQMVIKAIGVDLVSSIEDDIVKDKDHNNLN